MTHGDFKDLSRRTALDKVLRDKAFDIAKNSKHDEYHSRLVWMVYKSFDKNYFGGAATRTSKSAIKFKIMSKQKLAEELQKPIIKNFEKQRV